MPISNKTQDTESLGEQIAYAEENLRLSTASLKVAELLAEQARRHVLRDEVILQSLKELLAKMPNL